MDFTQIHLPFGAQGNDPRDLIDLGLQINEGLHTLSDIRYRAIKSAIRKFVPYGDYPPIHSSFARRSESQLISLIELIGRTLSSQSSSPHTGPSRHPVVVRVMEYLHCHYDKRITLGSIAKKVCLSPSHLSRLFKKETGENIFGSLLKIRLRVAAGLLKHSFFSTKEIADRTGFTDVFYFSKIFKRHFGFPPGQFSDNPKLTAHFMEDEPLPPSLKS